MLGISGSLQRLRTLLVPGDTRSSIARGRPANPTRDAGSRPLSAGALRGTEHKSSRTGALVAFEQLGQPVWSPRDYSAFAREGFMQNAILYRSVRMIAEAAASIPLILYEGDREIEQHPLLDLMRKPSYDATGTDFLESWYGFLLVAGNAYVEAVNIGGEIRELHILRPDRMKVIPGPDGWPEGYEYTAGGQSIRFMDEVLPGVRPILHVKMFHPVNDHYGMSPIEAAGVAIDIHNEASKWNKALLDNSARPSGALVYAASNGQMTGEQFQRLKDELEASYQGARHAGRPLLLEGGLDWKPLSLSPKDMDFIEAKNSAAREIALALGVPPMLLGIPGDNTYSNYAEAQRAFWRQTVLPLVNRTAKGFSQWLSPSFALGDSASRSRPPSAEHWSASAEHRRSGAVALELKPDLDQVEALNPEREALWARLNAATFLTEDEKRTAAGYQANGEVSAKRTRPFDVAAKFNPNHDELGRFTFGDGGSDTLDGGSDNDQLAQPQQGQGYQIDLLEEDARGGHTNEYHIGKSAETLKAHVRQKSAEFAAAGVKATRIRAGSFPSISAATRLTNSTLSQNSDRVSAVARGEKDYDFITSVFASPTGTEAYANNVREAPSVRETYGVGVRITHDPNSKRGFTIITSYPRNND